MKILTSLLIINIALSAFIIHRLRFHGDLFVVGARKSDERPTKNIAGRSPQFVIEKEQHNTEKSSGVLDEKTLRNVIREEIAFFVERDRSTLVRSSKRNGDVPEIESHKVDEIREWLDTKIESFLSAGEISARDMEVFQQEVNKLPEIERLAMSKRLARTINVNQLKIEIY